MNIVHQALQGHLDYMIQVADELSDEPKNEAYRRGYADATAKWLHVILTHMTEECPLIRKIDET